MAKVRHLLPLVLLVFCVSAAMAQAPGEPQGPGRPAPPVERAPADGLRATNYDVHASIDTVGRILTAQAKVDFTVEQPSSEIEVELHQDLRIIQIRDASGSPLSYERDSVNPLKLRVTLPDRPPVGSKVTVEFDYSGPLSSDANSPAKGVRLAYIDRDNAYLLLPGRWFPLTNFPANRYTGVFQIEVPGNLAVVGTGTSTAPVSVTPTPNPPPAPAIGKARKGPVISPSAAPPPPSLANERMLYTFHVDQPEAAGTFVAAPLQLSPVPAAGLSISVYSPPAQASTSQSYADTLARVLDYYNGAFGALSNENFTIAQLPDGSLPGFSAPGLLLVSAHMWTSPPNARLLANLAAQQWWGTAVAPATPADVWITAGLARYSEALFVEDSSGKEGMNNALQDFAVGALMYENAAPIADAQSIDVDSPQYESVIVNKGAMVFHMLRSLMGDANFFAVLKEFAAQYNGKSARIADFERLAEARAAQAAASVPATEEIHAIGNASAPAPVDSALNLQPFFTQWLQSTGVPEFQISYVVYRTKKGFRIVGKIKQNLDLFHMDVEMEVLTEGNPEFKTIPIAGPESSFTVETFGRPKPNGVILDPHNYILKASEPLRVRGIIARGESLAEQGKYFDAVQQYQQALKEDSTNALADFRMGEAFFYERNYAASAQAFRDALNGSTDLSTRWTEVWSHIYIGHIYDIEGDRTRAVNEYSKAKQTGDDTGGAQAEADKSLKKPYTEAAA